MSNKISRLLQIIITTFAISVATFTTVNAETERTFTDYDVDVLARMVWGEARGLSRNEQKLTVWTVTNRLEHGNYGDTIPEIVRASGQFHGYRARNPVCEYIREVVTAVLEAWANGEEALIYPPYAECSGYLYFSGRYVGDSRIMSNFFRREWR